MKPIRSARVNVENACFTGLGEFLTLNAYAEARHEYTVVWIDCLAAVPRGIFISGDHASDDGLVGASKKPSSLPLPPPLDLFFR